MDKWYALTMDDYAKPGFVSFTKLYFGTADIIDGFMQALRSDEDYAKSFANTLNAYDQYLQGEVEVTHYVAYAKHQLMTECRCLGIKTSLLEEYEWEHLNAWLWPYEMRCKIAQSSHAWIVCNNHYYRVIKTDFTAIGYLGFNDKLQLLGDMTIGLPYQIERTPNGITNRMYVIEKEFRTRKDLAADMNQETIADINFTEILNDVYGDG